LGQLISLYINFVISRVDADESDVDDAICVVDPNDQSVFIACNIENHSSIFEDAGVSEVPLYIGRCAPVGMLKHADTTRGLAL
jgi:hypothetical protein